MNEIGNVSVMFCSWRYGVAGVIRPCFYFFPLTFLRFFPGPSGRSGQNDEKGGCLFGFCHPDPATCLAREGSQKPRQGIKRYFAEGSEINHSFGIRQRNIISLYVVKRLILPVNTFSAISAGRRYTLSFRPFRKGYPYKR